MRRGRQVHDIGVLRGLDVPATLRAGFLCDQLAHFHARYPQLQLDLQVAVAASNLARREADLAVRLTPADRTPDDPELLARKVGRFGFSLFGSRRYLAEQPLAPGPVRSLAGHRLLDLDMHAPRALASDSP